MPTFRKSFNPTLDSLIKSFNHISTNGPVAMDTIPLCRSIGYKWLWGMKDLGWLTIERSKVDGRSHIVSLTIEGKIVQSSLLEMKSVESIFCHRCGVEIDRFFKVSNKEWQQVTGDEHDQVICKCCYVKMKDYKEENNG